MILQKIVIAEIERGEWSLPDLAAKAGVDRTSLWHTVQANPAKRRDLAAEKWMKILRAMGKKLDNKNPMDARELLHKKAARLKMSNAQIAREAGIPRNMLSDYFSGKRDFLGGTFEKVATAMGIVIS